MKRLFSAQALSEGHTGAGIDYRRNLLIVTVLGMVGMAAFALGFLVMLIRYGDLKILICVITALFALALCGWAFSQARKGQLGRAMVATFVGFALAIPVVPLVFAGVSNQIVLVAVVAMLGIGLLILRPRQMYFVVVLNIVEVMLYVLVNTYPPFAKVSAPGLQQVVWPVIGAGTLVIVGLLLFFYRSLDLSGKLIVAYTVVALVVTGALGYMTIAQTGATLTSSVGASLASGAAQHASAVGNLLENQVNTLRALSVNESLQRRVRNSNQFYPDTQTGVLERLNAEDLVWRDLVAAGNYSDPNITARLENEVSRDLQEYIEVFPYNGELILTDIYGGLIAASEVTSDYYQGDEYWWTAAYNDGKGAVYISKPAYDESMKADGMVLAVPVLQRDSGEVVGILRTTVVMQGVTDVLNAATGSGQNRFDLYFPGQTTQRLSQGTLGLADATLVSALDEVAGKPFAQLEYDGKLSLVARQPVIDAENSPEVAGLGWYLVGTQPAELALAPVNAQRQTSLAVTAIIVALVSLVAVVVAQIFASPIIRLTETAEQVGAGNLSLQAPVQSHDEIGRLTQTFNQMTARLRETLGGLEQRIADRTRELTLAGNVGRTLAQEHNLDRLLKLSVELIRSSFDLYYAQIYLADPSGRSLILRAGSGAVGAELVRRGHRLAVGPGSLNGSAAARREPVLVADTAQSPSFRPNALLMETRSEMVVPLLLGDRVVGVLDMQSRRAGAFSTESLPAFEALAGQLAVAVDNAQLLAETQAARQEVERQARRMVRSGWEEYLDGIHRHEKLGYVFQRQEVRPLEEEAALNDSAADPQPGAEAVPEAIVEAPILVTGEPVGSIRLVRQGEQAWAAEDTELVNTVAAQVARQVDSLRLLEQAERFRLEAEAAARRLVHEGWEAFTTAAAQTRQGYHYDQVQVLPGALDEQQAALRLPLQVRGEDIGELLVASQRPLDPDEQQLAQVVADRLSVHLESLRLAAQTQSALSMTETLYRGSEQVVRASTMQDVLRAIVESTPLRQFDHASLMLFNRPWVRDDRPETAAITALWEKSGRPAETPLGFAMPLQDIPPALLVRPGESIFVADLDTDERLDPLSREALRRLGHSASIFPLVAGTLWIGWLSLAGDRSVQLADEDMRQVQSLAAQAATVLQGLRLLEQSQNRAERERVLRQVAERVRSVADAEQVLRTAAREVGAVLGRNVLVRLAVPQELEGASPGAGNGGDRQTAGEEVAA